MWGGLPVYLEVGGWWEVGGGAQGGGGGGGWGELSSVLGGVARRGAAAGPNSCSTEKAPKPEQTVVELVGATGS